MIIVEGLNILVLTTYMYVACMPRLINWENVCSCITNKLEDINTHKQEMMEYCYISKENWRKIKIIEIITISDNLTLKNLSIKCLLPEKIDNCYFVIHIRQYIIKTYDECYINIKCKCNWKSKPIKLIDTYAQS